MIDFNIGMGPEQGISNLTALLATLNFWEPGAIPAVGDTVKSHSVTANCMLYAECTVSGTTGSSEPEWPAAGQTVVDGTVTWTIKDLRKPANIVPIGVINQFAGAAAPVGYLLCQGQAVSRSTYADLYAVIGTTYGTGDGSTTFNLPNLQDRVGVGKSSTLSTLGATGGEKTHALTTAELASHNHSASAATDTQSATGALNLAMFDTGCTATGVFSFNSYNYPGPEGKNGANMSVGFNYSHGHSVSVSVGSNGSGSAHNNMQPYLVVNYIIKY
ncbi:phage tail protein [Pectinatus haikarae]|uniref:phage tail protein n=1 Tax=Pectinatus haikarae TaxID=349096 RepID=UPI0018C58F52|nr:tail fiber protein [Pectinatus haikarae]